MKIFKYLFFIISLVLSLAILLQSRSANKRLLVWGFLLFLFCLGPSIIVRLFNPDLPHLLAGSKANLSIGAIAVGYQLKQRNWVKLEKVFVNLLFFTIAIAVMQQIYGYFVCPIEGAGCIGITEGYRSTGTFSEPNTLGSFAVSCLLVVSIIRSDNPASLKITLLCMSVLFF